jgi:transcriptional regulator with XRE-family HTH domain
VAEEGLVQAELGAVKEGLTEPERLFVERLRDLYRNSGWQNYQEFEDAIRQVDPDNARDKTTLSRYLSGDRRPPAPFLDQLFAALDNGKGETRRLAEDVKADTRRLYYERIRESKPVEFRAFEAEERLRVFLPRYREAERQVGDLQEQVQAAYRERVRLEDEYKTALQNVARATNRHDKIARRIKDLKRANERACEALTLRIHALEAELEQAKDAYEQACRQGQELTEELQRAEAARNEAIQSAIRRHAEQLRAEQQAQLDELVREHQQQRRQFEADSKTELRAAREQNAAMVKELKEKEWVDVYNAALTAQLDDIRGALSGESESDQRVAISASPVVEPEGLVEALAIRLRSLDEAEQLAAVALLNDLIREHPRMVRATMNVLCHFVRRVRAVGGAPHTAGSSALRVIVQQLQRGYTYSVDLSGVDLSGELLLSCNLRGAKLSRASLSRSVLRNSDLTRAQLREADLRGAVLQSVCLDGADLSGATGVSADSIALADVTKNTILPDNLMRRRRMTGRPVVVDRPGSVTEEQTIGRLLQQARERAGLSLAEISASTRLTFEMLRQMESGEVGSFRSLSNLGTFLQAVDADSRQISKLWQAIQERKSDALTATRVSVVLPTAVSDRRGGEPAKALATPGEQERLTEARSPEMDSLRAGQARAQLYPEAAEMLALEADPNAGAQAMAHPAYPVEAPADHYPQDSYQYPYGDPAQQYFPGYYVQGQGYPSADYDYGQPPYYGEATPTYPYYGTDPYYGSAPADGTDSSTAPQADPGSPA